MTTAKAIEYRISQQLMRRREDANGPGTCSRVTHRLISVLSVTVVLAALGSYLPELLWVLMGAGSILVIGTK